MKVLVTGGGGFLGRHVVERLLARGLEVRVLGRSAQPELEKRGVEIVRGDIADATAVDRAVAGTEAVFHVAAKAGVWGPREEYFSANVLGTRHVLAACVRHGVGRLVYTSTPSVVFTGEAFSGADESLPYGKNWLCPYPETKAQAEREVLAASGHDGLLTCALRPHLIWGVGDPHIVPRLVDRARRGRLRIVGDGTNRVDITHVKNAALAHELAFDALEKGTAAGRAYFLSQGEPVVLWDWINNLLSRLGEPVVKRRISARTAYRAGRALEWIYEKFRLPGEPAMTRFVAVELSKDHWYDISAARRDLGYASEVSTEAGLDELVEDWMS
ncbi:NAD-dependent epimerase/dehydratase family protein [Ruficoccus amylovorans]|uniref:NAD-dependent epimerase/dehydratase family protein n=1 Tax=Ruficoccus amylovorans TaxID=1804625 RepID=A0A842HKP0_9BACT|nr:NAD-dependent epimerase/dehydratase family protein [Ruficoccus amylovorans]MBC2596096.1 NAD-dependent epimerase/dehydratase family protein [Ruficoccus amylovorans]